MFDNGQIECYLEQNIVRSHSQALLSPGTQLPVVRLSSLPVRLFVLFLTESCPHRLGKRLHSLYRSLWSSRWNSLPSSVPGLLHVAKELDLPKLVRRKAWLQNSGYGDNTTMLQGKHASQLPHVPLSVSLWRSVS